MKNKSLMLLAVFGLALGAYAQQSPKQEPVKKEKKMTKRERPMVDKKKEVPAEKVKN